MKALIFTGGMESNIRPVTGSSPRALLEINGEPLLSLLINRLSESGFDEILINVHHFASSISDFIMKTNFSGVRIAISDETELLMHSGAGLNRVEWFFDDDQPFLIHNLEILSDIDLLSLYRKHLAGNSLATLVVRERKSERHMLFDNELRLSGWENRLTGELQVTSFAAANLRSFAFSRIQVVNREIFSSISGLEAFSLVELYLMLAERHFISGYIDNESIWMDLAKKEGLLEAEKLYRKN